MLVLLSSPMRSSALPSMPPVSPPLSPPPPSPPPDLPLPPLQPLADGFVAAPTIEELRTLLEEPPVGSQEVSVQVEGAYALRSSLKIHHATTVTMRGVAGCTLDALGLSRHFDVALGAHLHLEGCHLTNGAAPIGGSILVREGAALTTRNVRISNSRAYAAQAHGGAIAAEDVGDFYEIMSTTFQTGTKACASSDGQRFATVSIHTVWVWELPATQHIWSGRWTDNNACGAAVIGWLDDNVVAYLHFCPAGTADDGWRRVWDTSRQPLADVIHVGWTSDYDAVFKPTNGYRGDTTAIYPTGTMAIAPNGLWFVTGGCCGPGGLKRVSTTTMAVEKEASIGSSSWGWSIYSIAVNSDSSLVATGHWRSGGAGDVALWDPETLTQLASVTTAHDRVIEQLFFSPELPGVPSRYLVTGACRATGGSCEAKVWEPSVLLAQGNQDRSAPLTTTGNDANRESFARAFTPDGTKFIVSLKSGGLRIFEAASGALAMETEQGGGGAGTSLAFNAAADRLVSVSDISPKHMKAFAWEPLYLTPAHCTSFCASRYPRMVQPNAHTDTDQWGGGRIDCIAYSPDGTLLVTGSTGGHLKVFDTATMAELLHKGPAHFWRRDLPGIGHIYDVAFSPDGSRIVSVGSRTNNHLTGDLEATEDGASQMMVWDAATLTVLAEKQPASLYTSSVDFSPDGTLLLTVGATVGDRCPGGGIASEDCQFLLTLWDAATWSILWSQADPDIGNGRAIFSPDGRYVASAGTTRTLRLWHVNATSLTLAKSVPNAETSNFEALCFTSDGSRIVTGTDGGRLRVWDAFSLAPGPEKVAAHYVDGQGSVGIDAIDTHGDWLVSAGPDQSVRVWNLGTLELQKEVRDLASDAYSVAFSPDGRRVMFGRDKVSGVSGDAQALESWQWRVGRGDGARTKHEVALYDTTLESSEAVADAVGADAAGGCLYTDWANVDLINVTATNCLASGTSSANGGAMAFLDSAANVSQTRIVGGSSLSDDLAVGGGISLLKSFGRAFGSPAELREVSFESCTADSRSGKGQGGGLSLNNRNETILTHVSFVGCNASESGGGLSVMASYFELRQSTVFNANNAPRGAAVIYKTAIAAYTIAGKLPKMDRATSFESNTGQASVIAQASVKWTCQPGQWMPSTGEFTGDFVGCAFACAAGSYGDADNYTTASCRDGCPTGSYCPAGSPQPIPCRAGYVMPAVGAASNLSCIPCAPGSHQPAEGQTKCTSCPAGEWSSSLAASSCELCPTGGYCESEGAASELMAFTACPAGTFSGGRGATSNSTCMGCPAGTFSPFPGATVVDKCKPCPQGTYASSMGAAECTQCEAGEYQNASGATDCILCPARDYCPQGYPSHLGCESGAGIKNAVTRHDGETSSEACVCKEGFYDDGTLVDRVNCTVCPSGTDCSQSIGVTKATLPVKRGYYRLHESSVDVRRCPDAAVNCSDAPECEESASGCRGTVDRTDIARRLEDMNVVALSTVGCYGNLEGVFCRRCAPRNDSKPVFYSPATTSGRPQCNECGQMARDQIIVFVGSCLGALAVALVLYTCYGSLMSEPRKKLLSQAWTAFKPHNKLKILIGFYMIAVKIDVVYDVELPAQVKRLLSSFEIAVSFGFNGAGAVLECLDLRGYRRALTFYMVAPAAMAVAIVIGSLGRLACARNFTATALLQTAVPALLKLIFLAYPFVTNAAFDAFYFYRFDDGAWLRADVDIKVGTAAYDEVRTLAWIAILMYPIGLLTLVATLLLASRRPIRTRRPTGLSRAIAFLHKEFDTEHYWWEVVEMLRRLVLIGMMVLINGTMQLVVGGLLAAVFLLVQVQAAPYNDPADNFLASASSFSRARLARSRTLRRLTVLLLPPPPSPLNARRATCLLAVLVMFWCAYAFKNNELVSLPDIQLKMSQEQKELYIMDQAALAIVMMVGVIGAIGMSIVLFFIQLSAEGKRVRHEALASKARRLRLTSNDEPVAAPALPASTSPKAKCYHTFLSHVWGTGQDQMRIVKQRLLEMVPDFSIFLDVDDLEEIGHLEGYIDRTATVLIYCSKGYFTSKNCMRELVSSTLKRKPIIALIDPDASRGGLSLDECHAQLLEADAMYAKWDFNTEPDGPRGQELYDHLFKHEPIEWNRLGVFQDVSDSLALMTSHNPPGTRALPKHLLVLTSGDPSPLRTGHDAADRRAAARVGLGWSSHRLQLHPSPLHQSRARPLRLHLRVCSRFGSRLVQLGRQHVRGQGAHPAEAQAAAAAQGHLSRLLLAPQPGSPRDHAGGGAGARLCMPHGPGGKARAHRADSLADELRRQARCERSHAPLSDLADVDARRGE